MAIPDNNVSQTVSIVSDKSEARPSLDKAAPSTSNAIQTVLFKLQTQFIGWDQQHVLEALDITIAEGDTIAIVGKSGAGKTTLVRALHQQIPDKIAFCGQQYGLVPSLSVFHNIYMGQLDQHPFLYNLVNLLHPLKSQINAISPLAEILGLQAALFKAAEKLSGGQQQRVALARSLFQNRTIFIGDEPVSSVDEIQSEQILDLIISRHKTTIVTLHNVDLALRFCRRIIGIRNGKVELDCAAQDTSASELRSLYQD